MGIWRVTKAIVTAGGSLKLEKAENRYADAQARYESMRAQISRAKADIHALFDHLKREVLATKWKMRVARSMIAPRCLSSRRFEDGINTHTGLRRSAGTAISIASDTSRRMKANHIVAVSALSGTAAAMVAWQGAQVAGIASTGTAMIGLHGAAASNAGWALFGGGSLATGGGGMALGHLLLPGAGAVVAIGFGAVMTRREARRLNDAAQELERVNDQNSRVISKLDHDLCAARAAVRAYDMENAIWLRTFQNASSKLRRFSILSVLYRFIRFKITGVYYTAAEWRVVEELDLATRRFFSAMTVMKS